MARLSSRPIPWNSGASRPRRRPAEGGGGRFASAFPPLLSGLQFLPLVSTLPTKIITPSNEKKMKILLISNEDNRWGAIRLRADPPARFAETVALLSEELRVGPAAPAVSAKFVDAPGDDDASARTAQRAEAVRSRGKKLRRPEPIWSTACAPARASARPRRAQLVSSPKQSWKKARAPHARTARAFRL